MSDTINKAILTSCFLLLSGIVLSTRRYPATHYELSIYQSTPLYFFASIISIIFISIYFLLYNEEYYRYSVLLLGFCIISIVALPLIRGYHYLSEYDALSHAGTILDLIEGNISPVEIFYPGSHTLTAILSLILDMTVFHSVLLTLIVFSALYMVFMGVTSRLVTCTSFGLSVGVIFTFTLIPAKSLHFSPNEFARIYIIVVYFLLILIMTRGNGRFKMLLYMSLLATLIFHPQIAVTVFLLLLGISVVLIVNKFTLDSAGIIKCLSSSFALFPITYGILLYSWINTRPKFTGPFRNYISAISSPNYGGDTAVIGSLRAVGGSIPEIFLKVYLIEAIYAILCIYFIFYVIRQLVWDIDATNMQNNMNKYTYLLLFSTLVPVLLLLISDLAGGDIRSRYRPVLLLGGMILSVKGAEILFQKISSTKSRDHLVYVVLCLLIVISIPLIHSSPYVYNTSRHVPEAQVDGYRTAFEFHSGETNFVRVRSEPYRYSDAIEGSSARSRGYYTGYYEAGTPDHFANQNLHEYYSEDRLVVITAADRKRDAVLYEGFRYTSADFRYLNNSEYIDKVISNGGFDMYYLESTDSNSSH